MTDPAANTGTDSQPRTSMTAAVITMTVRDFIKTPKAEIDLVKGRLKRAEEHHAEWLKGRN